MLVFSKGLTKFIDFNSALLHLITYFCMTKLILEHIKRNNSYTYFVKNNKKTCGVKYFV